MTTETTQHSGALDESKAQAFAERMLNNLNGAAVTLMTSIGHRVRLFDTLAGMPPSTSDQIALAAGLNERYVREWLGAMVTGRVIEYDPANQRLRLLFESPSADVLNAPDNITVSPRGGLVLCEDGDGTEYVHGLTTDGVIFRFIQNNVDLRTMSWNGFNQDYRGSEFAGACYSPDGKWLFVNIQSPGISFAITGPWGSGAI